jgi:hypothetical protein
MERAKAEDMKTVWLWSIFAEAYTFPRKVTFFAPL